MTRIPRDRRRRRHSSIVVCDKIGSAFGQQVQAMAEGSVDLLCSTTAKSTQVSSMSFLLVLVETSHHLSNRLGIFHDSSLEYHCVRGHHDAAQNMYARSSGTLQPDNATPMWPRLHIWPELRSMFVWACLDAWNAWLWACFVSPLRHHRG